MEYDERLPTYYKNNYEFFSRYLPHVKHKLDNGLLEKSNIRWSSYEELKKEKKSFRSFYQNIVDMIIKQEKEITSKVLGKEKTRKRREKRNKTRKKKYNYK